MRVMLVGEFSGWAGNLESSYSRAFSELGCTVHPFDMGAAIREHCRLGRFGRHFNRFVPIRAWTRKANRDLILAAIRAEANLLVVFGQSPISAGALAQVKAATGASAAFVWPDTLLNLADHSIACLPLYDVVAAYSRSTLLLFEQLGARQAVWLPLAGDPWLHPECPCSEAQHREYGADVSFIGGWRPEREALLGQLREFRVKVWGPGWDRHCRTNRDVMGVWQGRALEGEEFATAVSCSRVNLNIIDPTNYPAANMRFFEIPMAGGLQVTSPCPEMEADLRHGEHLFYYQDVTDLRRLLRALLTNDALRTKVASAGRVRVASCHTYVERARSLLQRLEGASVPRAHVHRQPDSTRHKELPRAS